MDKISTAQEIWDKHTDDVSSISEANTAGMRAMIEFARIHVNAALKAAADGVDSENCFRYSSERNTCDLIEDGILGAYPLTNII